MFTIAGATQIAGSDAGLQPTSTLVARQLPVAVGCQGLATTGTAPFDAGDGLGQDSTASNCLVRTEDLTMQSFAVSLTGLPTGVSVANVIAEFTLSSTDAARFRFDGPANNGGLPTGCLSSGATLASSVANNPDGSATLRCNMGIFTSAVKPISLSTVAVTEASVDGSHYHLSLRAYAAVGDAVTSDTVTGPDIAVDWRREVGSPESQLRFRDHGVHADDQRCGAAGFHRAEPGQPRVAGGRGQPGFGGPLAFVDRLKTGRGR